MDEILEKTTQPSQNKTYTSAVVDTLLKKIAKSDVANKTGVYTLDRGWQNNKVKVNINMPIKLPKRQKTRRSTGRSKKSAGTPSSCPNMPKYASFRSHSFLVFSVQVCSPIQMP